MKRKNYPLRLNPEVYAALERWAGEELRSVNAQIEYLLADAFRRHGRLKLEHHEEKSASSE